MKNYQKEKRKYDQLSDKEKELYDEILEKDKMIEKLKQQLEDLESDDLESELEMTSSYIKDKENQFQQINIDLKYLKDHLDQDNQLKNINPKQLKKNYS